MCRVEAEAESILEQETLLGMPLTDNLTSISNLKESLEPLARLWITAKEYLDDHHSWLESPLRTVNAEEAERKVKEEGYPHRRPCSQCPNEHEAHKKQTPATASASHGTEAIEVIEVIDEH